jgi:hypothetical protein
METTMASDEIAGTSADLYDERTSTWARWVRTIADPSSHMLVYGGIALLLGGFGLLALGWARVAGLTDVWRQMPYLVSAGFPGLGLIMTGLLVLNIAAKRQDAAVRAQQMEQLTEALHDLKRSMDDK